MKLKRLLLSTILALTLTATTVGFSTVSASATSHTAVHHAKWYSPLLTLPTRSTVLCILATESQSTLAHPNFKDKDPQQFGPFQFTPILWNRWSWVAGVGAKTSSWYLGTTALTAVTIPAYRATLYDQAKVFATVARYDGLWPWTDSDLCG